MKNLFVIQLLLLFIFVGCSKDSTEPEPVGDSHISVSGDLTESYNTTALFGTSFYTADSIQKEYFSIVLIPLTEGSNPFAFTILFKSGPELPATKTYNIGKYAMGQDIPEDNFGGGFSGLNTEDFAGYTMTQGTLTIKSMSESNITGEFNMSGYWQQFLEEDSSRTVTIIGNFYATPMLED